MEKKPNPKVVISEDTKKILDSIGNKGDTYNDVIMKILARIGNDLEKIKKALKEKN